MSSTTDLCKLLTFKYHEDSTPPAVSIQWDHNNEILDEFMDSELDTGLDKVNKKNFMWMENVKEMIGWEKGTQVNIFLKCNCDGAVWLFIDPSNSQDMIIDEEGFVHFKFFEEFYTLHRPSCIKVYHDDNDKCPSSFIIRPYCEYNNKIFVRNKVSKYWSVIRKKVFNKSIRKSKSLSLMLNLRKEKLNKMINVVDNNKCKQYGYTSKKKCWKDWNEMYMNDEISAKCIIQNCIYSCHYHKSNPLILDEDSLRKLKNNIHSIPKVYMTNGRTNQQFSKYIFELK